MCSARAAPPPCRSAGWTGPCAANPPPPADGTPAGRREAGKRRGRGRAGGGVGRGTEWDQVGRAAWGIGGPGCLGLLGVEAGAPRRDAERRAAHDSQPARIRPHETTRTKRLGRNAPDPAAASAQWAVRAAQRLAKHEPEGTRQWRDRDVTGACGGRAGRDGPRRSGRLEADQARPCAGERPAGRVRAGSAAAGSGERRRGAVPGVTGPSAVAWAAPPACGWRREG